MRNYQLLLSSLLLTGLLTSSSAFSAPPPKNSLPLIKQICGKEKPKQEFDLHTIYTYICEKNAPQVFPWKRQTL